MSDTEDQLGPLRETVPIGIPSKAQSGRDRSTRCVGVWPYSSRSTTQQPRTHGLEGLVARIQGSFNITGRMFVNQSADLRASIRRACFPVALTFLFLRSDAYFPPDAPPSSPLGPPLLPPPVRLETTLAMSIDDVLSPKTEQELAIEYVSFHTTRVDSLSSSSTMSC